MPPVTTVIIETARGPEYGTCTGGNHQVPLRDIVPPLRRVIRLATEADHRVLANNQVKEKRAFDICQKKIQEHKLEMKLVDLRSIPLTAARFSSYFTADGRVDFRELVKDLAGGVPHPDRAAADRRPGRGEDGGRSGHLRPALLLLPSFWTSSMPVSIKMAKTQNLSLNPTKISGTCGRLMCCLKYEQEAYEDLLKTSPKPESFVDTPEGRGTVVDVNLLRQSVKVRMEEQPETIGCFHNCEICVLRNGKARKNDPPNPRRSGPHLRRRQAAQKGPGRGRAAYASGPHPLPLPPRRHRGGGAAPGGSAPPQERGAKV